MKIKWQDGKIYDMDDKMSIYDIVLSIDAEEGKKLAAATIDGKVLDLRTTIDKDCEISPVYLDDEEGLNIMRHTCSHILAQAVKKIYPEAKLAIGPTINEGFYYDIDIKSLSKDDLDEIEKMMKKIIKKGDRIKRFVLDREAAIKLMTERNEPYKVELINDLPKDAQISFYEHEDGFIDLCTGPHIMNTRILKAFKLISSSGAYWRGDEKRPMLTRIYGTCFRTKEELDAYLLELEDRKNRDHNKLGRELELFTTVDVIGQGLPLIMPRGAIIMQELRRWIEDEETKMGYVRTMTPLMAKSELYKISDHWYHYKEGMFIIGDGEEEEDNPSKEIFALRPMTCPFQYYIYKNSQKSYRDLPCRYGETSTLFRNEDSGEMHGLTRVRQFTISEGHLVVRPDQLADEFRGCLDLAKYCLTTLGLQDDVTYRMSKWDPNNKEKYLGNDELWDKVESSMREILDDIGLDYTEAVGEAAFYGPKLDIQAKNVYGKEDTMITIQLDMFLADRYDMSFIDSNGEKVRPYIIHRTSIGCYERTLAWLIEKYKGNLPLWLSPDQVKVLPISEKYNDYANKVNEEIQKAGIRTSVDNRDEKVGYKIRQAKLLKVPYIVVVGEKERDAELIAVTSRDGDEGQMKLDDFIKDLRYEIDNKLINRIKK